MTDLNNFHQAVKAGKAIVIKADSKCFWCCSAINDAQINKLKSHLKIPQLEGVNIWVDTDGRLNQHVKNVPEAAWDIFDATNGEITLVLPSPIRIANSALFADLSIAITIVKEQWASKMMQWLKSPLVVIKSENTNEHMLPDLEREVYVLNLPAQINQCLVQGFSVIKLSENGGVKILREQGQKHLPHL